MQCLSILGIFTFHRQQLVSTSDMPMQFVRVTRRVPIQGHFPLGKLKNIKTAFKGHASPFPIVHYICTDCFWKLRLCTFYAEAQDGWPGQRRRATSLVHELFLVTELTSAVAYV